MRRIVILSAALFLFGAPAPARADQGRDSLPPDASTEARTHRSNPSIRPGALVRGTLRTGGEVRGTVLVPFTMDSQRVVLCLEPGQGCTGEYDLGSTSVPMTDLRKLGVWGSRERAGAYLGFFGGALVTGLATDGFEDGNGLIIAGGFVGLLAGAFIGSRINGWTPIFPCAHGCAAGEYP